MVISEYLLEPTAFENTKGKFINQRKDDFFAKGWKVYRANGIIRRKGVMILVNNNLNVKSKILLNDRGIDVCLRDGQFIAHEGGRGCFANGWICVQESVPVSTK